MRVLITGAKGFLGTHLAGFMAENRHSITTITSPARPGDGLSLDLKDPASLAPLREELDASDMLCMLAAKKPGRLSDREILTQNQAVDELCAPGLAKFFMPPGALRIRTQHFPPRPGGVGG